MMYSGDGFLRSTVYRHTTGKPLVYDVEQPCRDTATGAKDLFPVAGWIRRLLLSRITPSMGRVCRLTVSCHGNGSVRSRVRTVAEVHLVVPRSPVCTVASRLLLGPRAHPDHVSHRALFLE